MNWLEVNFDGVAGPTHNYAGLSYGNVASAANQHQVSHPKRAALQSLQKMQAVSSLGLVQCMIPPQCRPNLRNLKALGFTGKRSEIITSAAADSPIQLAAAYSSAFMWTANSSTVSPSLDTGDQKLHLTPANMFSSVHRCEEQFAVKSYFDWVMGDGDHFQIHDPLPASNVYADEGAANHIRLAPNHHEKALEVFVYGRNALDASQVCPVKFPARQTLQSFEAIARRHQLDSSHVLHVQQNPEAIDAGAFHNDVVSVGNENVLFYHEQAFSAETIDQISSRFRQLYESDLILEKVTEAEVPLSEAVSTYLFNSQLLSVNGNEMLLLCPAECEKSPNTKSYLDKLVQGDNPISKYVAMDLKQSMMNGGGPACLRLRVLMSEKQIDAMAPNFVVNESVIEKVGNFVEDRYRDDLTVDELANPAFANEAISVYQDFYKLLGVHAEFGRLKLL